MKIYTRDTSGSRLQTGFALFEILISFAVLAFGMLGIAGLILTSHKANASSYVKQQVIQSLSNITDRIRANSAAAATGKYDITNLITGTIPPLPGTNCESAACTPDQLSAYDLWCWLAKDLTALPAGSGSIVTATTPNGSNTAITITVQWDDSPAYQKFHGSSTANTGTTGNLSQMSIQTLL